MHKLPCVMCMVVFVGGLLEAKNAQVTDESKNFEGPLERKKVNQANQGAIGTSKVANIGVFLPFSGSKKWFFNAKCVGAILKNVLPA